MIADDIDKHSIDLVEYHQPLSASMNTLQNCIIEIMDACLQELRRANPLVELDELTVENALLKSFDSHIRRLMAPVWHRVSNKSKTLLADMKLLRRLLDYLLQYDCVSFNSFLETVITSECITSRNNSSTAAIGSPWMIMDAADQLFKVSPGGFLIYV
jgi:DNA excision repair protein ERCC-4